MWRLWDKPARQSRGPIGVALHPPALHSWNIKKHMLKCACDVPTVANNIETKPRIRVRRSSREEKMSTRTDTLKTQILASEGTRSGELVAGIICMVMIANLQYGWTLFVNPIDQKYHWGTAAIQVAFPIFVVTETWLVPVGGYFVDRFGPRIVVAFGGVLVSVAWGINSMASSLG